MSHIRWSRLFTLSANLALCLALALSFAPAGWAGQVAAEEAENEVLYLPLTLKNRVPFIESTGLPDTSFDGDGWAMANFGTSGERGYAAAVQTDGKIVVAGLVQSTPSSYKLILARYNPDGSLDFSFDHDGKVITNLGGYPEYVDLALQSNEKIVAMSLSALTRYNSNGSLDNTFGEEGVVNIYEALPDNPFSPRDIILQPLDGKIVLAGSIWGETSDFAVARFNPDGSLDTSFAGDGVAVTDFGDSDDTGYAAGVQADGKIVVAGKTGSWSDGDFALARYNTDGSPDTTFGESGLVTADIDNYIESGDQASAVAVQADGKIVAVGYSFYFGAYYTINYGIALARFNPDGSLDTDFANAGTLLSGGGDDRAQDLALLPDGTILVAGSTIGYEGDTDFLLLCVSSSGWPFNTETVDFASRNDEAHAIALQPLDGKIVLAGFASGASEDLAVVRYNPNYSLDSTFDGDGKLLTEFAGSVEQANAVALQPDGKIIAAGYVGDDPNRSFALVRFNPDGSPDATFDGDGMLVDDFWETDDYVTAMALQPDGKIVVAGYSEYDYDVFFALARYNPDGSLDGTFSFYSRIDGDISEGDDYAKALALQPDGKILVAGYSYSSTMYDFALARYNPDGSLDTTFAVNGVLLVDFEGGYDQAYAIALQPDGKIILAGRANSATNDFGLVRCTAAGVLDPEFDGDGKVVTDLGEGEADVAAGVALQADGKIVAVGSVGMPDHSSLSGLARYNPDGSLDTSFSGDGKLVIDLSGSSFFNGADAVVVQPNAKIVVVVEDYETSYNILLARFNPDGSLDNTFSGDGVLQSDLAGGDDEGFALALQPDGKIIVAGFATPLVDCDLAVVRYK